MARSNSPGLFSFQDLFKDLGSGNFNPIGGLQDAFSPDAPQQSNFNSQDFLSGVNDFFGLGALNDNQNRFGLDRGTPGGDIFNVGQSFGQEGRDLTDEGAGLFSDLNTDFGSFFEDARGRLDSEFPLNPFSDERFREENEFLQGSINDTFNSLANQAGSNLNVRGLRGGAVNSAIGNLNQGRLQALTGESNALLGRRDDFNQRAAEQRAGFFQNFDQLEAGLKLATTDAEVRAMFEKFGIISGEAATTIAGINANSFDDLTQQLSSDSQTQADQNNFWEIMRATGLLDANNLAGASFFG